MRKINYPYKTDAEKETFLNEFFNKISPEISNYVDICKEIKKVDVNWDFKKLLTADFSELMEFAQKVKSQNINTLDLYFKWKNSSDKYSYLYTDMQPFISDFLIEQNINIKSCFYCNIEYINDFKDQYLSITELINYAPNKLLKTIISESATNKIAKKRKSTLISENDIKALFSQKGNEIAQKLKDKYEEKYYNEHFTLDHVLPKNSNAFLSISIFNLVPCCYSCNTKFKLTKEFNINNDLKSIVPSSKDFLLDDMVKFKLKYKDAGLEKAEDIDIRLSNVSKNENVDEFIAIFRLQSRYNYHKNISYDMIQKRKIYSDSQIKEIATLLKRDEQSVKKDLFGKECFESNNEPFEKYKQDIAEQLGLI